MKNFFLITYVFLFALSIISCSTKQSTTETDKESLSDTDNLPDTTTDLDTTDNDQAAENENKDSDKISDDTTPQADESNDTEQEIDQDKETDSGQEVDPDIDQYPPDVPYEGYFEDNLLKLCVENALINVVPEEYPPSLTPEHMARLTELSCYGGISSIRGIENLPNLESLDLIDSYSNGAPDEIKDFRPIGKLVKLKILRFGNHKAHEIPENFKNLINLEQVFLKINNITNPATFSRIGVLPKLKSVEVQILNPANLDFLNSYKNTTFIQIEDEKTITNIDFVEGMTSLEDFVIRNSLITSIAPLTKVKSLVNISIDSCGKLEGLNKLTELTNLKTAAIMNCSLKNIPDLSPLQKNIEGLNFEGNLLENIDFARNLSSLKYFSAKNNNVSDLSPLSNKPLLERVHFDGNKIKSIPEGWSANKSLNYVRFPINEFSDLSSFKALENLKIDMLFLEYNYIVDITPLKSFYTLSTLMLSHNCIIDFSPLDGLKAAIYKSNQDNCNQF